MRVLFYVGFWDAWLHLSSLYISLIWSYLCFCVLRWCLNVIFFQWEVCDKRRKLVLMFALIHKHGHLKFSESWSLSRSTCCAFLQMWNGTKSHLIQLRKTQWAHNNMKRAGEGEISSPICGVLSGSSENVISSPVTACYLWLTLWTS